MIGFGPFTFFYSHFYAYLYIIWYRILYQICIYCKKILYRTLIYIYFFIFF